jgi:hypothetical protein
LIPEALLGMPLDAALALCREAGMEPAVRRTDDPRGARETGTPRVVRVRGSELTVSLFRDGAPVTRDHHEG